MGGKNGYNYWYKSKRGFVVLLFACFVKNSRMVVNTYSFARRIKISAQLHSQFKASLGYIKTLSPKNKKKQKTNTKNRKTF